VLASPPPPPNLAPDDDAEGDGADQSEADQGTPRTPSSWHQRRAKTGAPRTPVRLQEPPESPSDAGGAQQDDADGQQGDDLLDAEQHGIAQRLVAMNLPMGLIKASGYSPGPTRGAHLPPASTSAILFLNDCLQKMPHLRRHCSVLLDSTFIAECKDVRPSAALDWIRDPASPLAPPDTTESSSSDKVCSYFVYACVRAAPFGASSRGEAWTDSCPAARGPSRGAPTGRPQASLIVACSPGDLPPRFNTMRSRRLEMVWRLVLLGLSHLLQTWPPPWPPLVRGYGSRM